MNTATLPTPLLWDPTQPTRCACDDRYKPQLTKGKLVKSRDRAWRMAEQTRDPQCLQEQARAASKRYPPLVYVHHNDSRKANSGYPDVHLWAPDGRGSVYIELKKMRHTNDPTCDPSPAQIAIMASLAAAGHLVYLGRPCCLLTGVIDRIMADRAGMEPRGEYVIAALGGGTVLPTANVVPAAPELAATPPPPRRPDPEMPGTEPPDDISKAVGYLVPMTAVVTDPEAMREVEGWLRAAGFPPTSVPFPLRIVAGGDQVAVLVRAADGKRVWRGGRTRSPFPDALIQRLRADTFALGSYRAAREFVEFAVPNVELPDKP